MNELVERLSQGDHPVEASLRPARTAEALKERIDLGYVHVKFTDTRGGTELGYRLDQDATDVDQASFEDKSCYDCHDEAAFYHSFYGVYFDYYYDSPWFGYYSDPWWYDSGWGSYGGGDRDVRYDDSNKRHRGMRGLAPEAPRGSSRSPSTAPYLREDYQGRSSKPSEPPAQADKPKESTKEKSSDQKRHRGGRGKKK